MPLGCPCLPSSPSILHLLFLPIFLPLSTNGLFSPPHPPSFSDPFGGSFGPILDVSGLLAHSNRIGHNCRHYCSISDPGAEQCWNDTLTFYEQMLVGTLRKNILAETNRVLLMIQQNDHLPQRLDYHQLINDSFQRFMELPRGQVVKDANNWADAPKVFGRISPAIMDSVVPLVNRMLHYYDGDQQQQQQEGVPPLLMGAECPRGCERSWSAWRWLFLGSLLLSLLQLALLALLVIFLDRREQSSWRLESQSPEFGDNASVAAFTKSGRSGRRGEKGQIMTMKIL